MALFAPMARPSVRIAMRLNAGDFTSILSAYHRSVSILYSVYQRDQWVCPRGANGVDVTRQQRDDDERDRDAEEGHQVKRADVEEQGAKRATAPDTKDKTDGGTD